jgi:hypothetical protein
VRCWEQGQALPYPYYREKLVDLFGKTPLELGLLPPADEQEEALPAAAFSEMTTSPAAESTIRLLACDEQLTPSKQRLWSQVFSAVYGQLVNRLALDPATAPRNVIVNLASDFSSPIFAVFLDLGSRKRRYMILSLDCHWIVTGLSLCLLRKSPSIIYT